MSLKSTKTLLNIFFNDNSDLQSDTKSVDLTDKSSILKRDLAARDLSLLNNSYKHLPILKKTIINDRKEVIPEEKKQVIPEEEEVVIPEEEEVVIPEEEEVVIPKKQVIPKQQATAKSFKVNPELLDLGEKPLENNNSSSSSIRKKVLQQQLNELRNGDSRKKYIKKNKSKTKRKSST
uniref:Uncharacterized protein n=1 Tax=viral metagenome TaxID=1070528 RepID=A0A6C0IFL5_9ZZZZ